MSEHTKLIISIIETTAAIEDSNPQGKYGTSSELGWNVQDTILAVTALDNLIAAATIKQQRLKETRNRQISINDAVERERKLKGVRV